MDDDTFTCDRCGGEFPRRQMKEAFHEEDGQRVRRSLCPSCLDAVMNEADRVQGVAGEEKRAAIHIDEDSDASARESFGQRE
jgi:hypothetical protein